MAKIFKRNEKTRGGRMNNFEKIKTMSIEEMAEYMGCEACIYNDKDCYTNENLCNKGIKQWLEREVEE